MWFVFRVMCFVTISPEHQRPLGVKPPAVAPNAAMAHSWATIVDMAAQAQMQPKERSNEALKHYRDLVETNGAHGVHIPLNTPTMHPRTWGGVQLRSICPARAVELSADVGEIWR